MTVNEGTVKKTEAYKQVKLKLELDGKHYTLLFDKNEFEATERTEDNKGSFVKVFATVVPERTGPGEMP